MSNDRHDKFIKALEDFDKACHALEEFSDVLQKIAGADAASSTPESFRQILESCGVVGKRE